MTPEESAELAAFSAAAFTPERLTESTVAYRMAVLDLELAAGVVLPLIHDPDDVARYDWERVGDCAVCARRVGDDALPVGVTLDGPDVLFAHPGACTAEAHRRWPR